MADNKKIYQIQIDGIAQSEAQINSLLKKLNELENKLKNTSSTNSNSRQLTADERDLNKALEERARILQSVNKQTTQASSANKEYTVNIKQISSQIEDARKQANTYAQTLNNLCNEIQSLSDANASIDFGGEVIDTTTKNITRLSSEIDSLEKSLNSLGNVSDSNSKDIKSMNDELDKLGKTADTVNDKLDDIKDVEVDDTNVKRYTRSINDLQQEISKLENSIKGLDINSSEFNEATEQVKRLKLELVDATKQMEAAVRAEDQLGTKIRVNAGGMTLEFDDVNQAIGVLEDKLYALSASGQKGTSQFKAIQAEVVKLKREVQLTDTAIDNMVTSMNGLGRITNVLTTFTSVAAIGQGIGGLFGNNEDIAKSIQKLQSFLLLFEGLKQLDNEMKSGNPLFEPIKWIFDKIDKFDALAFPKGFVRDMQFFSEWDGDNLRDFARNFDDAFSSVMDVAKNYDENISLDDALKATKEQFSEKVNLSGFDEESKKGMQKMLEYFEQVKRDGGSAFDYVNEQLGKINKTTLKVAKGLNYLSVAVRGVAKAFVASGIMLLVSLLIDGVMWLIDKIKEAFTVDTTNVDGIKDFNYLLEKSNRLLDEYKSKVEQDYNLSNLEKVNAVLKRQRDEFDKLGQKLSFYAKNIKEIESERGNQNFKQYELEYDRIMAFEDTNDDDIKKKMKVLYDQAIYELKDIFAVASATGDYQKAIDTIKSSDLLEATINYGNEVGETNIELYRMAAVYKEILELSGQINESEKERKSILNDNSIKLRDLKTSLIADPRERQKQQLRDAAEDELKRYKGDADIQKAIREKLAMDLNEIDKQYYEQRMSLELSFARQMNDINKQIRDNYLAAKKESLMKEMDMIENQRKDEINDAKTQYQENLKAGEDRNPLFTYEKLQELIKSINAKYDKQAEDKLVEHTRTMLDAMDNYAKERLQIEQELREQEAKLMDLTADLEYDKKLMSNKLLYNKESYNQTLKHYEDLYKIEKDYADKKYQLEVESIERERQLAINNANEENTDALNQLARDKQDGKYDDVEYMQLLEQQNQNHQLKLQSIEIDSYNKRLEAQREFNNNSKELLTQYLSDSVNSVQVIENKITDLFSSKLFSNERVFLPIRQIMKAIKEAQEELNNAENELNKQTSKAESEYQQGNINSEQYNSIINDINNSKKIIDSSREELNNKMKESRIQLAQQVFQVASTFASQIGQFTDMLFQQTLDSIDRQLEELDKQMEIVEESYDRAEEAAEAHKDRMNEIEDELSEARGSRKQFLIDALAAQQEAYLADVKAQEDAEAKKKQIEEQQKVLERKRKQEEKKANIAQSIINGFMAVSNALAVQPFPLGMALASVAAAMAAYQTAGIINTPIYRDGGLLVGASHESGGVKVLGGQAEVEGGEYIVNKRSAKENIKLLEYVNGARRTVTMADLAMNNVVESTPVDVSKQITRVVEIDNRPIVVDVRDIIRVSNSLRNVQVKSGVINRD